MRLALACAVLVAACTPAPASREQPTSGPAPSLYLTASLDGSGLIAIDPLTLGDISNRQLLTGTPSDMPSCPVGGPCALVAPSGDGRSLAVVGYKATGPPAIFIFDTRTGSLRSRPIPEVPVIVDGLNADGSRIYTRAWPPTSLTAERLVLDGSNGKIVDREPAFSVGGEEVATLIDSEQRRIYALVVAADPQAIGPRQVAASAWDLKTGTALWRREIPGLIAGSWLTGRTGAEGDIRTRLVPGLALSPDGRRLAIVRAFDCCVVAGTYWLLDTTSGDLSAERKYSRGTSILEQVFGAIAAAKEDDGVTVGASFGPDGQVLYITGQSWKPDGYQYLGMTALDVESTKVLGSDIKMEQWWYENHVFWLRPSADGRWLYVFLQRTGNADPKGYFLRRVDARTLSVAAERRFDSYRFAFSLFGP